MGQGQQEHFSGMIKNERDKKKHKTLILCSDNMLGLFKKDRMDHTLRFVVKPMWLK